MSQEIETQVYDNRKHPPIPQSLLTVYKHAEKTGWHSYWTHYSRETHKHILSTHFIWQGRHAWASWEAKIDTNRDKLRWKFKEAYAAAGELGNLYIAKLTYTHFVTVIKNPQFTNIPQAEFLYRFPIPKG